MVATRRLKDEPDRLLLLGARLAHGERGAMLLYNPNHDAKGKFSSGGGGGAAKGEKSSGERRRYTPEERANIRKARQIERGDAAAKKAMAPVEERILSAKSVMGQVNRFHAALHSVKNEYERSFLIHTLDKILGPHESAFQYDAKTARQLRGNPVHKAVYDYVTGHGKRAETAQRFLKVWQTALDTAPATKASEATSDVFMLAERPPAMMSMLRFPDALQRVQRFDETGPDGFHRSWIMLFPVGHYQHEQYGELDFTPDKLQKIKAQYDQRVRHIDAALDVDHRAAHDDSRATGWIESLELRDRQPDGTPAGLWGCIKWTPYGLKFLNADEYRYFSPEFGPWDDPQTGEHFEDVLIGGALTNRPFLKTMPAIALADGQNDDGGKDMPAAISRKPWGSIKKSMLPRSAFLIQGDPNKKETWRLPVYEGTGPLDADGCYTRRGPLNINGVKAAWGAINGAHTGEPMSGVPAAVIAKLKAWKAQYFPDDGSKTAKQAMEGRVSRKLGGLASVDTDLLDDEDDDEDALTLADGGKPAKGSAAMKAKMAGLRAKSSLKIGKKKSGKDAQDDDSEDSDEMAEDDEEDDNAAMAEDNGDDETYDEADGDGPDEELAEDDEDAEQYADAEDAEDDDVDPEDDEEEGDDEDETPAPKAKSGRSGKRGAGKQMAGSAKRMMGARTAVSGGAHVRAAESARSSLTLAEQRKLTEENARLKYQLYEVKVEETLALWKRGRFQFKENAKDAPKSGRIALSKAFSDAFRAWMRAEGVRLSEGSRTRVLGLIEIALSSAVVDLSERGSSYDPEGRMMASARRKAGDDDRLQQVAERIALAEHGKSVAALTEEPEKVLAIYSRAAEEMRY